METIGSRVVYTNPWLTLREDSVRWPDGHTGIYSVVVKDPFTVVVPSTGDGFWLVEQYRYPIGRRAWEFPQGSWGAGAGGTAEELARAELAEETGLRAGSLRHLGSLHAAYGMSNQSFDVWLAGDLVEGEVRREVTEQDMIHRWFPAAEVDAMIRDGRMTDAHSVAALHLLRSAG